MICAADGIFLILRILILWYICSQTLILSLFPSSAVLELATPSTNLFESLLNMLLSRLCPNPLFSSQRSLPNSLRPFCPTLCATQIASSSKSGAEAKSDQSFDVVVVGGGAAGLTAAYFAAQNSPNGKVAVVERTREAGRKVMQCTVIWMHVSLAAIMAPTFTLGDQRMKFR